jgi:hypothetical protein
MLLFRSEEHVDRWCKAWKMNQGAILTLAQQWQLAQAWYSADRRDPHWRRKTADETEATFAATGLAGPFWSVRPPA